MLNNAFCCLCLSLCGLGPTLAQEPSNALKESIKGARNHASFVVQLKEYRLKQSVDLSQSVTEISELLMRLCDSGKCEPIETIRFSTLNGAETMVQFGRRVNMLSGSVVSRGQTHRNMTAVDVGTIARATVTSQADKVVLKLTFESSRPDEDGGDDVPPQINNAQFSTVLLLDLGKPSLVGNSAPESSSIIMISVTEN